MVYLFLGSSGGPLDQNETAPSFSDFQRRMWAREVDLADRDTKIAYGRVHWQQLVSNMRSPRYEEALRIVSDRHRLSHAGAGPH
jgi:hypothetical protein